ncbi:MAG: GDSL-type esterase/lipase family protein [Lactobacillaceae bacterium]|jgi:lysophospholipase L1-like esterase|nr:GDSL-type esterase/lipase family protein [Lactobacillaceae bacterium]
MRKIVKLLLVVLLFSVFTPTVEAKTTKLTVKKSINLVTIGDSLTEGIGDTKKQGGYEKRTAKLLEQTYPVTVKTANYGKAGDRSDQILARIKKNPSALKVIAKADVIVMTAGGNDLQQELFKLVTTKDAADILPKVDKQTTNYHKSLNQLVSYVRTKNKTAPIFLFGNYNPLYVYLANRPDLNNAVHLYNGVNWAVTKEHKKMYYVTIFKTLTYGQYQTKTAQKALAKESAEAAKGSTKNKLVEETLNGPNNEKNEYITTEDHYHPNDLGYDKMSQALVGVMIKNKKEWLYK